jgi:hypothetical protein
MTKPIAQTFYISGSGNSNAPGSGVFVTRIDVYFKSVSATDSITLEIRQTDNGIPTSSIIPFASRTIDPNKSPPRRDMLFGYSTSTKSVYRADQISGVPNLFQFPIASDTASIPTAFEFETPVFLESNKSYAFVLRSEGGGNDYVVWTADFTGGTILETGYAPSQITVNNSSLVTTGTDVTTGTQVSNNNDTGDLFLSSNDRTWDPIITEDIKFELFIADFTSSTGQAYFTTLDEDWVAYKNVAGPGFKMRESLVFSNGYHNFARLTVSSSVSGISVGDTVRQGSVAIGIVNAVSSGKILLSNTGGAFSTSTTATTGSVSITITGVSQNVVTTSACNVITVPDASIFEVNQLIFLQTSNRSTTSVFKVDSVNTVDNKLILDYNVPFTESNARNGRVKGDGELAASFSGSSQTPSYYVGFLDRVTSTTSSNLHRYNEIYYNQMIGLWTGTSAQVLSVPNYKFNTIKFNYNYRSYNQTALNFEFSSFYSEQGLSNSPYKQINMFENNNLIDKTRIFLSRSNSLSTDMLPVERLGESSVKLRANLNTSSSKVSPVIDTLLNDVTVYENYLMPKNQYNGTILQIDKYNCTVGDIIYQNSYGNSTYGVIVSANTSHLRILAENGKFINDANFTTSSIANNTGTVTTSTSTTAVVGVGTKFLTEFLPGRYISVDISDSGNGTLYEDKLITSITDDLNLTVDSVFSVIKATRHFRKPGRVNVAQKYNESMDNGIPGLSRYISKNVILSEGQDAEDINVYATAYRPASTDFLIYAKIINTLDHEDYDNKSWTKLKEISPPSLQSSPSNTDDQVELIYGFNKSYNIFTSGSSGNSTYSNVTVTSTQNVSNNSFVYFDIEPAKFTGYITSGTLTLTMAPETGYTGVVKIGQKIYGNGLVDGSYISAGSGTSWTVLPGTQTVASSGSPITMTSGERAFNVREIIYVANSTTLTLNKPLSTNTGNASFGIIPGADSTTGAFLYDNNNNIVRYCTDSDSVYDSFIQFRIKVVPTAYTSALVPTLDDIRVLALQV